MGKTQVFKDIPTLLAMGKDWQSGRYTKSELSRKYKTSISTITRRIDQLSEQGLI